MLSSNSSILSIYFVSTYSLSFYGKELVSTSKSKLPVPCLASVPITTFADTELRSSTRFNTAASNNVLPGYSNDACANTLVFVICYPLRLIDISLCLYGFYNITSVNNMKCLRFGPSNTYFIT